MTAFHTVDVKPPAPDGADLLDRALSDFGGHTRFAVRHQTLAPGARASERHWHDSDDEFLSLLYGEATVVENDGPHRLGPGDLC